MKSDTRFNACTVHVNALRLSTCITVQKNQTFIVITCTLIAKWLSKLLYYTETNVHTCLHIKAPHVHNYG